MRLSGVEHLAAEALVKHRQRTGAQKKLVAFLHDEIGIGTDELEPAAREFAQRTAEILGRADIFRHRPGAQEILGILLADTRGVEAVEQPKITLRAHMEQGNSRPRGDDLARQIARGHEVVPGFARHAELRETLLDRGVGAGRIGDEDHDAATGTEAAQRVGGVCVGFETVVKDAPDIAQDDVESTGERAYSRDDRRCAECVGQKGLRRECKKGLCAKDRNLRRQGAALGPILGSTRRLDWKIAHFVRKGGGSSPPGSSCLAHHRGPARAPPSVGEVPDAVSLPKAPQGEINAGLLICSGPRLGCA